jgi:hypothetical protein
MDPAQLIPAPDTIPVAWPWLKGLLLPCFAVHLLFMNALLGTAVIGWAHALRPGGRGLDAARSVSGKLPFFMAFTINFGVAALLFLQVLFGHFLYASSILMARWWLSILALVLAAYGVAYWIDIKFDGLGSLRSLIWTFMVVALLLVGFVFVNNLTLLQDPGAWPRYFQAPAGMLWHTGDPALVPRYLHFVTASVAVGGLVMALLRRNRPAASRAAYMQWFAAATALQLFIGAWFFTSLPAAVRRALMGGDTPAAVLFAVALLGVLLALVFGIRQRLGPAVAATLFTVGAMVLLRDTVRAICLAPFFTIDRLVVHPQYSPMAVFGLFLVLGLAAVGYMVRLYLKGGGP